MAQVLLLHQVYNDGAMIDFPGTEYPQPLDCTGEEGFTQDTPTFTPIWIGTNAAGTVHQSFPFGTPVATMLGTPGVDRLYLGTKIIDCFGAEHWVTESFLQIQNLITHCCSTSVGGGAYALKQSPVPLTPGQPVACGTEASFKWLAVKATGETRNLVYTFHVKLTSEDGLTIIEVDIVTSQPLAATTQLVKAWVDDFVGMSMSGVTLVANDQVPGIAEMRVGDFGGGVIEMTVTIVDDDTDETVNETVQQYALPGECPSDESVSESVSISPALLPAVNVRISDAGGEPGAVCGESVDVFYVQGGIIAPGKILYNDPEGLNPVAGESYVAGDDNVIYSLEPGPGPLTGLIGPAVGNCAP